VPVRPLRAAGGGARRGRSGVRARHIDARRMAGRAGISVSEMSAVIFAEFR